VERDGSERQPGTVSAAQASALLMISQDRVRQLARDGVIPKAGRDAYPLAGLVQGYLRFLRDEARRSSRSAAGAALHNARRLEVEQKIADADRRLVDVREARALFEEFAATARETMAALPASITADPILHNIIKARCDDIQQQVMAKAEAWEDGALTRP